MTNEEFEKQWQTLGGWDKLDRMANAVKKLIREQGQFDTTSRYSDYFIPTPPGLGDEQNNGG